MEKQNKSIEQLARQMANIFKAQRVSSIYRHYADTWTQGEGSDLYLHFIPIAEKIILKEVEWQK